jgi:hypothetical protein
LEIDIKSRIKAFYRYMPTRLEGLQPYHVDGSFDTREFPVQQIFLITLLYIIVEEFIRKIS